MAICLLERAVPSRPSTQRMKVASVLKELRERAKLSQEELAALVGLSYAGYRPYEQGKRDLNGEQIPVFAEALRVTRAELATRLGLGGPSVASAYAAEVDELLQRVDDPAVIEDIMMAIRAMSRVAERKQP